jgi:hypothetical protein
MSFVFNPLSGQFDIVSASPTTLTGDVTGTGTGTIATTVASVDGSSAANIHSAELAANAATNLDTFSTIVKRDGSGNFSASTITANLTGNASGSASSFTGSLIGDVTGTQGATVVASVGGSSASSINTSQLLTAAATSANTPNTIVLRDGGGSFSAGPSNFAGLPTGSELIVGTSGLGNSTGFAVQNTAGHFPLVFQYSPAPFDRLFLAIATNIDLGGTFADISLWNGQGIALGNAGATYTGHNFYIEPQHSWSYTPPGSSLGVGTATPSALFSVANKFTVDDSGNVTSSGGTGSTTSLSAGNNGSADGGNLNLSSPSGSNNGSVTLSAGTSPVTGNGGNVAISATGGVALGGGVSITAGNSNGTAGSIVLTVGIGTPNGAVNVVNGNLAISTVGNGIQVKGGSNAKIGSGTLVGGTVTISNTSVTTNSKIFVQDTTSGSLANVGSLVVSAKSAGTSFTVTSSNILDTSTFDYFIVEQI